MNKIAVVTGASSGIGKATAVGLAKRDFDVFIICRDPLRGHGALREIQEKSNNSQVELFVGDLSSQHSIHCVANQVFERTNRLDLLVHCAGVILPERQLTIDHLEMTFAVNHLAPFLLTQRLLPLLEASSDARIWTVTSRAEKLGRMDFDNLQGEKKYSPTKSYCQSKLANLLFTYELARRLEGTNITANCFHPGLVDSNLGRHLPNYIRALIWLIRPFMTSSSKASEALIHFATDPSFEAVSGKYFMGRSEAVSSKQSYDIQVAKRLWDISERLVNDQ